MIYQLSPGMIFFMGIQQLTMGHMGIDLSRRDIDMPQHHLDGAQVGTAFEQMRCK